MNASPGQHVADATALVAPVTSIFVTGQSVLSGLLVLMGVIWYGIQIGEWVRKKFVQHQQTRESANRVALKLQEERHGAEDQTD